MFPHGNIPAFLFFHNVHYRGISVKIFSKENDMKMKTRNTFFLFLLAAALVLMACPNPAGEDDNSNGNGNSGSGIDFTNHLSGFSIKVQNNTAQKLVAFKNAPGASNLIGGVPNSGANEHGLPKPSGLFTATGDFVLFLVTEQDYIDNKNNLNSLATKPFTKIYAYYNANAENNIVYPISGLLGGNKRIVLQNNTGFNVELRENGVHGSVLGYAGQGTFNTTFNVDSGDYMLFPVFRKYNANKGEIITVYPRYQGGPGDGKAKFATFSLDDSLEEYHLNASNYVGTDVVLKTGSAYLIINNQHSEALSFIAGNGGPVITPTGGKYINSTKSLTFSIDMPKMPGSNDQYLDSIEASQYKIGTEAYQVSLPSFTFESDKIYTIRVTGQTQYDINLGTITYTGDIDFDTF
jgi:hypothetical protein